MTKYRLTKIIAAKHLSLKPQPNHRGDTLFLFTKELPRFPIIKFQIT